MGKLKSLFLFGQLRALASSAYGVGVDVVRLEAEMVAYQQWLDERADEAYIIAEKARNKG